MRITKNLKAFMCLILILSFITAVLTLPWSISYAQSNNIQNSQPDLIGVVKSISGSKITIYIAKLSSQSNGRGFGRGRVEPTNKTQTITVSSKTSIVTRTFQNGQIAEKKLSTKDLKPNNILYIWYADSKKKTVSRILVQGTYNPYQTPEAIGIVKKVESNKITITVATIQRPQPRQNTSNNQPQQRMASQVPQGGFSRDMMNLKLSNQTKTIAISKSTVIVTRTFQNGQMTEKKLTVKDLKTNNIVYIWYSDSKKTTAKRIMVMGAYSQSSSK
ncbi:hypothetical protein Csac_2449 [Caldicellulosiruptor saccharolyticus DSM 8903]|uniref:Uncharacterized protein n=1 Tax=Caldicellulosiruptor saccharolyticus (strain ATCC 43494 / DSM 8903 / Tp8T 6331) TaxID=351627 RepID=A4XM91_CALS8|nr:MULTISPECIES: hypothetical protein [Caldicellulosiruptor]ABP68026.2 hypothetical protein Csac_2449 [Caldicellulosiruptor saccharolyticus DSM 8903]